MKPILFSLLLFLGCAGWANAQCVPQTAGEATAILTWTNNENVSGNVVEINQATSASGPFSHVDTVSEPTATATETITLPTSGSVTYYWNVNARLPYTVTSGSVNSSVSNTVCKTFSAPVASTVPIAPTALTVQ